MLSYMLPTQNTDKYLLRLLNGHIICNQVTCPELQWYSENKIIVYFITISFITYFFFSHPFDILGELLDYILNAPSGALLPEDLNSVDYLPGIYFPYNLENIYTVKNHQEL